VEALNKERERLGLPPVTIGPRKIWGQRCVAWLGPKKLEGGEFRMRESLFSGDRDDNYTTNDWSMDLGQDALDTIAAHAVIAASAVAEMEAVKQGYLDLLPRAKACRAVYRFAPDVEYILQTAWTPEEVFNGSRLFSQAYLKSTVEEVERFERVAAEEAERQRQQEAARVMAARKREVLRQHRAALRRLESVNAAYREFGWEPIVVDYDKEVFEFDGEWIPLNDGEFIDSLEEGVLDERQQRAAPQG
jgi:hypothetical protein